MAPTFFKSLRRRSRASFRTDQSTTDDSSEGGANSQGTGPSSGAATPASIQHQSDPALNLQIKDPNASQTTLNGPELRRPPVAPNSNRHSVSGMSGLGAPSIHGRPNLPVSQYAPRVHNAHDGIFVRWNLGVALGSAVAAKPRRAANSHAIVSPGIYVRDVLTIT